MNMIKKENILQTWESVVAITYPATWLNGKDSAFW